MSKDVLRRLLQGFGANAYGQVVTTIVQIVGVPILLYSWGKELYGVWLILFAIPSYLSVTDLGFSQSAANDMTARTGRGDREGALRVFHCLTGLIYTIVALGLILSALAFFHLLPLQDWLHFELISTEEVRLILWLLSAQVLISLLNGVNHAGFRASGEYALHVGLTATVRLVQFAGVWMVALAGGKLLAASIVFSLVQVIASLALAVLLVRRHRWLSFSVRYARWGELRRLLKPSLANMAIPAGQALSLQGMVLVVGAILGPVSVVVFSTLRTLTRLVFQLAVAISNAVEPEIATAYGMRNHNLIKNLFVNQLRAAFWLSAAASVGLVVFGDIILRVWTHGAVRMHPLLFILLLISSLLGALWFSALNTLKAANLHVYASLVYTMCSAAVVGLAAAMLEFTTALAAAGLALLVMDIAMMASTMCLVSSSLKIPVLASVTQAANPCLLCNLLTRRFFERRV